MLSGHIFIVILLSYHLTTADDVQLCRTVVDILLLHFVHPFEAIQLDHATIEPSNLQRQQDLIDSILRMLAGRLAIRHYSSHSTAIGQHFLHLVFIDGDAAFNNLLANRNLSRYDTAGYYLLVISEADPPDQSIDNVLTRLWRAHLPNVNVIFVRNGHVLVHTFFPFQNGRCKRIHPELLLNQTALEDRDKRPVFYWNRLRDFHGCTLLGGTFEAKPFIIYRNTTSNTTLDVGGFEGDLMQVLAEKLNFSLSWKNSPGQWGFARKIGQSTGLMKMTQLEEVNFAIGCLAMDPDRHRYLKAGASHYTSKILFAVPHGRPFTALEKLIGPFQTSVLVMQAVVLAVTGLVVLILRFTNSRVRAFVYGRGISTPFLNAIALLFGGSLPRLPVRNFARTLLMFWIVYCFILASLYQGSLYDYLQKPMHYPPLRTMREIDRSGLHYYMVDVGTRFFVHNPSIVQRTIIIPPGKDSLGHVVAQLGLGRLSDGVVLSPMDLVAYNNRVNPRSRFVHIAREHVSVFPVGLYYPKRSPLRDVFDEQVRMIVPSGLVHYWIERYGDYDFFARPKEKSEPRKLSNAHLVGVYQLYGCCLAVSAGVFLQELVVPRVLAFGAMLRRLIE